jgi:Synaptobrevin
MSTDDLDFFYGGEGRGGGDDVTTAAELKEQEAAAVVVSTTKILWSCVARNDTILAEASSVTNDDAEVDRSSVAQIARELLARKATPGFEFHSSSGSGNNNLFTSNRGKTTKKKKKKKALKAVKFHVYEHVNSSSSSDRHLTNGNDDADGSSRLAPRCPQRIIWVFGTVYDPEITTRHDVQSFLEKIVTISENFREHDAATWRTCSTLGLQSSFAPILQQRMEEVSYLGHMALLDRSIQACQYQMEQNIERILSNGEHIQDMNVQATHLQDMAGLFRKRARAVKRYRMFQNAKQGLILGTALTAATAVIVIPPLVAIL